ncbi:MAG TPA: hypothetical protein VFQ35_11775, partial [Polyangiaceae bacterium]|nr:hypothetical protein [Polyangiaceae bacterium]
ERARAVSNRAGMPFPGRGTKFECKLGNGAREGPSPSVGGGEQAANGSTFLRVHVGVAQRPWDRATARPS